MVRAVINNYNYFWLKLINFSHFSGDLPVAPKCKLNLSFVGAFSAEWNGVAYKTLKTCSKRKYNSVMLYLFIERSYNNLICILFKYSLYKSITNRKNPLFKLFIKSISIQMFSGEQESGGEFHYEKYEETIHRKCNVYTQELAYKYKSWKKQVEEWSHFAINGLEELIVCKMPKGYNGYTETLISI